VPEKKPRAVERPGPRHKIKQRQPDTKKPDDVQAPGSLAIYSSRDCIGHVVMRSGKSFRALTVDGHLGDFPTVGDAADAVEESRQ
jgi:hypothetical protein